MIQMIKGTDILLYSGINSETVSNVLIGEPSSDGKSYTLGIPKNDEHDWTDRKISFFGCFFRSIGYPQQGITENIPLCWGKNVKVELVDITGKCTIYSKDTYSRHVFDDVFFYDGRGEKVNKNGAVPADTVRVKIYSFAHDGSYYPKPGDIVVNRECQFEFDTSSEQKLSESMADFRKIAGDVIVISSARATLNGAKPDFELIGR